MNSILGLRPSDPRPAHGLASWYVPGATDGFGDRLLMFDNTDTEGLEMLRFRASLAGVSGFSEVLEERIRQLGRLTHSAFPRIRALERLESDGALVLVSTYTPGRRLSALLADPRLGVGLHPAFVTWVVGQVMQPLSILQSTGDDFAHAVLTPDRIVLTPDGQIRVIEHVLGSALRHLDRSSVDLWREFGLLVPADGAGAPRLDARADVFQVGVVALSMLLARRLTFEDLDERLPQLLDQWSSGARMRSRPFGDSLRRWIERALQVGDHPYHSAAEAYADLRRLPSAPESHAFEFFAARDVNASDTPAVALQSPSQSTGQEAHMDPAAVDTTHVSDSTLAAPPFKPDNRLADRADGLWLPSPAAEPIAVANLPTLDVGMPPVPPKSRQLWTAAAAGLAAVALVEAVVIATFFVGESPEPVPSRTVTAPAVAPAERVPDREDVALQPPPPAAVDARGSQPVAGREAPVAAPEAARGNAAAISTALALAAKNQRSGGVRLSAPIELNVLQGDRVLGSSADGPIVTTEGTHQLDLINTAFGFRVRQAVTFRAGEITTVAVPVPPGRVSVNADPWAEVWIDSRPLGETPLANLEIPIGEHEIVFRHPELGERRQTVIVRADTVTRVSASFTR